jgi:esterase/lipase superfamily enzyme
MNVFEQYKTNNSEKWKVMKPTMLVHSMGNLVFQSYINSEDRLPIENLFNNIILNASDVDTKDHHKWINKITESRNIYITFNNDDPVLHSSAKIVNNRIRLGQKLSSMFNGDYPLASNVIYIDFTQTRFFHKYYLKSKHHENPAVMKFYNELLNGEHLDLMKIKGVTKQKDIPIFVMPSRKEIRDNNS